MKGFREKKEICPNCNGEFKQFPPRAIKEGNKFAYQIIITLIITSLN